ncbi:TetR/AcrR family transcriptional regulator [Pseudaminobacter sp. 19-2017]|uniref:TetR/AcrR family transcriptional regulator n=1 Tax=Pseudaminobacter soli (ex Zhang et al. 2022) TaxID=2831468 RepID=A0A942DUM1_9HYPH|nr:TetR/AcrR family transcriptional regulator [Pseudaminobacter soli]MBS3647319.1 TetR/AcrR family transcriptional regulator [Pseudaminobacter soli]
MVGSIDRRVARTRRALHDALMGLILRKGFDALTVQDIAGEADVGRSTFYAHYPSKEELLRDGFRILRSELSEAIQAAPVQGGSPPLRFSLAMFEHAGRFAQTYRVLVLGQGGVIAIEEISRILADLVRQDLVTETEIEGVPRGLAVQYVVTTFITVLRWWLEEQPNLTAREADRVFRRLAMGGLAMLPPEGQRVASPALSA